MSVLVRDECCGRCRVRHHDRCTGRRRPLNRDTMRYAVCACSMRGHPTGEAHEHHPYPITVDAHAMSDRARHGVL